MRHVILDTETTGLNVEKGHRIIEIGCIEVVERRRTGRYFHRYLNPQREIDAGAMQVHGITDEFLKDKPPFAAIADEFLQFVSGASLIIHNAPFDLAFLDAELGLLGAGYGAMRDHAQAVDTLVMARERFPGQKNSLDALCKRFGIDNRHRELHGALLDASLLLDVYLAMTAGQVSLALGFEQTAVRGTAGERARAAAAIALQVRRANSVEASLHEEKLLRIEQIAKSPALWRACELG